MKTIVRRLRRLEDRFCPPVETESSRRLRERIEAGRRLADAVERGEWCRPVDGDEREDFAGLGVAEILHRGRARVARAKAKLADHNDEEDSASIPSADPTHMPPTNTIA